MSIIIEIVSQDFKIRSGVSSRTNKNYSMREQIAFVHKKGERYPEKIKITLEDNQAPYPAGNYDLAPSSFYVDKYDSLCVRPVLIPRPPEQSISNTSSIPDGVGKAKL